MTTKSVVPSTIREYAAFVDRTDAFKELDSETRRRIAVYGLASEIGSVVSAVKKERLKGADALQSSIARDELRDEIGDVIWYCFALARIEEVGSSTDILTKQIARLVDELTNDSDRSKLFRERIGKDNRDAFLKEAAEYPHQKRRTFDGFQSLAFKTARTEGGVLLDVCLAVLTQLAAQLMRIFLTEEELKLNTEVNDRDIITILGEVAWHLAALATLYGLTLSEIVSRNREKLENRQPSDNPTPLHDENVRKEEQLPRKFDVQFITVGKGRSRMYWNGRQLGDDLTDNAEADGYRFHDVLHLAHIAHLGWSPVVRSMMKRKRKSDAKLDEIQDGARAKIVEETIIKMVHSEGLRIAEIRNPDLPREQQKLFTQRSDVSHSLLSLIDLFTDGLETSANKHWEWTNAIISGFNIYSKLVDSGQGTVTVDTNSRTLTFSPHVHIDVPGAIAGFGQAIEDIHAPNMEERISATLTEQELAELTPTQKLKMVAAKTAILNGAGFDVADMGHFSELELHPLDDQRYSIRAHAEVEERLWSLGVISVRTAQSQAQNSLYCSALLIADTPRG